MTMMTTQQGRIPLAVQLAFTAFMAVIVPVYWVQYGPTNFLYFCDTALFLTLAGIWTQNPLLVSIPAVGIIGSQFFWVLDFVLNIFGVHFMGMSDYMFDERRSLFLRGLSLFHGWLPFLLVYLVLRTGYDRRALPIWTGIAWALVLVCWFWMPGPSTSVGIAPVNINYVYGFSDTVAQTWFSPTVYVGVEMVVLLVVVYLPVHFLLRRYVAAAPRD